MNLKSTLSISYRSPPIQFCSRPIELSRPAASVSDKRHGPWMSDCESGASVAVNAPGYPSVLPEYANK
jgi:hypothetical protein